MFRLRDYVAYWFVEDKICAEGKGGKLSQHQNYQTYRENNSQIVSLLLGVECRGLQVPIGFPLDPLSSDSKKRHSG